jgi:myo-inositol 2-dehydrogenase/D-chiro-inositol 1-dehydrogenase
MNEAQTNTVRIGVIGVGRIGRLHAENLATRVPGAQVVAVADPQLNTACQVADSLHIPLAVADYREVLSAPFVDAVAICSSTDTHAQIMVEAACAGKHIFCEKPIAHDLRKIDEALRAVAGFGVKLQVGFNRRFDPNFRKVREMVMACKIGQPHLLRITSRDPAPPPIEYVKRSGGLFLDMTIHDFDMARYLMGCEVEEVYATGGVMVDPRIGEAGDLDTAVTTLRFTNGALGTIDNSRRAVYGYDQRAEVFGSGGMVAALNASPDTHLYLNAESVHSSKPLYYFVERYAESFVAEMKEFVDCLRQDRQPQPGGVDGRMAVVIGIAAGLSYRENRPVRLSEVAPVLSPDASAIAAGSAHSGTSG